MSVAWISASLNHILPAFVYGRTTHAMGGVGLGNQLWLHTPTRNRLTALHARSKNDLFCSAVTSNPPTGLTIFVGMGKPQNREIPKGEPGEVLKPRVNIIVSFYKAAARFCKAISEGLGSNEFFVSAIAFASPNRNRLIAFNSIKNRQMAESKAREVNEFRHDVVRITDVCALSI